MSSPSIKSAAFLLSALLLSVVVSAREPDGIKSSGSSQGKSNKSLAAQCAGPTAATELAFNNVRTLIQTSGDMWWDYIQPRYEVPKGSGKNALFAGALWLGGEDVNQQLKLAAHTFGPSGGNYDFWTGPLTTDGAATVTPPVCQKYDRHWVISRKMVEKHVAWAENPQDFPNYTIPKAILNWPAHGDVSKGQAYYLAPFYDFQSGEPGKTSNATYEPENGDYPHYDLKREIDCRKSRLVTLFGDKTFWWVFNDKGNVHTQTNGDPIGMEVRAQAFAFATNDAVNDMTFYNYQLINRGSQTLTQTHFAQWVDADLGCANDDYVGCDVSRGLGFAYNGDNFDQSCQGATGYGSGPPAIGVDFFEGPYQDSTGVANETGIDPNQAVAGNGVGYGDSIVDNERFGMRHFFYYNRCSGGPQCDPQIATEYFNYMRGYWKDGTRLTYFGDGYDPSGTNPPSDFMFPGSSDPQGWGTPTTSGAMPSWTEESANNQPGDRRFLQSAGPFTLKPGDVNDITVGVVFANSPSSDAFSSVNSLKTADSKAQSLFDNCFEVLNGPDAPLVKIQELDQELILTLSNPELSNNYKEQYEQVDPFIQDSLIESRPDSLGGDTTVPADKTYDFQGYKVYQVKNGEVGPSDLDDPNLARLVAQVDIKDDVTSLVNYNLDKEIGSVVPVKKADSVNQGISHSFSVTEDQFARGDGELINHQEYYFMAVAYAYNEYKPYDPSNPDLLDGQKQPYLESRRAGDKSSVEAVGATPHLVSPEDGGTVQNSEYGQEIPITRIEGRGNGGNALRVTQEDENKIVENGSVEDLTYKAGSSPIKVKVIDPLNVPDAEFELRFNTDSVNPSVDSAQWTLENLNTGEVVNSRRSIASRNEQLIPEWGIAVTIHQYEGYESNCLGGDGYTEPLQASLRHENSDESWLTGLQDQEGNSALNWILAGNSTDAIRSCQLDVKNDLDDGENYEKLIQGTWAPFPLASTCNHHPGTPGQKGCSFNVPLSDYKSVNIVFTDDKSKWTRCPVLEMQSSNNLAEGGVDKFSLRAQPAVNKEGEADNSGKTGMGWFPGYAIDVESGKRLNMAFGEDSWLSGENGADMKWNPTSSIFSENGFDTLFGGKHYVYLFAPNAWGPTIDTMTYYDEGEFMYERMKDGLSPQEKNQIFGQCMWVGAPLLRDGEELLANEATVRLRVGTEYEKYQTGDDEVNDLDPMYQFSTSGVATEKGETAVLKDQVLDTINVVPNPYYAYSNYEGSRLDNRIKIINLPEKATIKIYDVGGTLIRTLEKDNPSTEVEWDLRNQARIPISGGMYLMHVKVPNVGETTLKWFGAMRPTDLENF